LDECGCLGTGDVDALYLGTPNPGKAASPQLFSTSQILSGQPRFNIRQSCINKEEE